MYFWRSSFGTVDLAFTDRRAGDLAVDADSAGTSLRRVTDDFAPGARVADMRQLHGAAVGLVEGEHVGPRPEADALVSTEPDTVLVVRVADCVPVLMADADAGVVAAVHAGRPGLAAGVVPAAIARMRTAGATTIRAWIGPHVCGACYEVPREMQAEVGALVPAAVSTTSWGTPALDIGAGVGSQLHADGVEVVDVAACTRESAQLHSYRRDGAAAGRFVGLVRRRG